jgi:cathepsin A (carboxypeptidase C)
MKSIILLVLTLFVAQSLTPSDFEVTNLPGLAQQPSFKHYSGFIEATPGNFIFFWFVES